MKNGVHAPLSDAVSGATLGELVGAFGVLGAEIDALVGRRY